MPTAARNLWIRDMHQSVQRVYGCWLQYSWHNAGCHPYPRKLMHTALSQLDAVYSSTCNKDNLKQYLKRISGFLVPLLMVMG